MTPKGVLNEVQRAVTQLIEAALAVLAAVASP